MMNEPARMRKGMLKGNVWYRSLFLYDQWSRAKVRARFPDETEHVLPIGREVDRNEAGAGEQRLWLGVVDVFSGFCRLS